MTPLMRALIVVWLGVALGLGIVASARADDLVAEIERAEAIMAQPWHITDTLTPADKAIGKPIRPPQYGKATWYGRTGNKTANGERFPTDELTCAHRDLPFGTKVRVTVVSKRGDGRSIRCRINDRGPFLAGRIIDLSPTAAAGLGLIKPGKLAVRVDVLP